MSLALQLMLGGALFLAVDGILGGPGVATLALVLLGAELNHDLRLYREGRSGG